MKSNYIAICSKTSLPKIREFVAKELQNMDVQSSTCSQVVLAVDEACANSIIHQHSNDGKANIQICIYRAQNVLTIALTAEGEPFSEDQFAAIFALAKQGCAELTAKQNEV